MDEKNLTPLPDREGGEEEVKIVRGDLCEWTDAAAGGMRRARRMRAGVKVVKIPPAAGGELKVKDG